MSDLKLGARRTTTLNGSNQDFYQTTMSHWRQNVPVLYDMFLHQSLEWPAYTCCWGSLQPDKDSTSNLFRTQRLFMSRSTDASVEAGSSEWKGHPNCIEVSDVLLPIPRAMDEEKMVQFSEESKTSNVIIRKKIIHPGEVNRIKVCHQHADIIATHADHANVFVWNTATQPDRPEKAESRTPSDADLVLKGHTKPSTFALDFSSAGPLVISGGEDHAICLWSLEDEVTVLAKSQAPSSTSNIPSERSMFARATFRGHELSVEDCTFHPSHGFTFASVGDDRRMLIWDSRSGSTPAAKLTELHITDINCVSWNKLNSNLILTGSSDCLVKLIDIRYISDKSQKSVVACFKGHKKAITVVQWSPFEANVFATSSEDTDMFVVDSVKLNDADTNGIIMLHAGHRSPIVYFDWSPCDPWTIASVSDESSVNVGGGTLQMWRMNDLLNANPKQAEGEIEAALRSSV